MIDLDAIEARANAATDGPWVVKHEPAWEADNVQHPDVITVGAQMWEADDEPMTVCLVSTDHEDDPVDVLLDAEFIAHARTDVPALVAEVRSLRTMRDAHTVTVRQAVAVERQRDEARAAVARVRALHYADYDENSDGNRCAECLAEYPCPTIRALDVRHDSPATVDRCPECRHAPHSPLGFCPNLASDNDCSCTYADPSATTEGDES